MDYRRLGRSGLKLSVLSYGSWVTFKNQVDVRDAKTMLKMAFDHGVNFFDNAEVYAHGASEEIMGRALADLSLPRDEFCVSSKAYFGRTPNPKPTQRGLSRKHLMEACHAALRRMDVDYLDLYFCHRPDPETPIEETVRAMSDLIAQGKVLYWGTSEWSAQEIMEAYLIARRDGLTPPTMEQPQYNLLHRDRVESEYARVFQELGLGTTIWSPLASGLLTGKYNDGVPKDSRVTLPGYEWLRSRVEGPEAESALTVVRALGDYASDAGVSLSRLAIAWCLKNPNVTTVLLGASSAEQLKDNLQALEVFPNLDDDAMADIDQILALAG